MLHGGVTAELAYNPILAVINDDVANIIGRTIEGFEVNEETMALELIHAVGPNPGSFLGEKHTLTHWKKEYFVPVVADRLSYDEWIKQGKKSIIDRANERMEKILSTHKPLRLRRNRTRISNESWRTPESTTAIRASCSSGACRGDDDQQAHSAFDEAFRVRERNSIDCAETGLAGWMPAWL